MEYTCAYKYFKQRIIFSPWNSAEAMVQVFTTIGRLLSVSQPTGISMIRHKGFVVCAKWRAGILLYRQYTD